MFLNKIVHKKEDGHRAENQNPKILEVNLIKEEGRVYIDRRKNYLSLAGVLFVVALFVAELYFGLDWWSQQEGERAQTLSAAANKIKRDITQTQAQAAPALAYKEKSAVFTNILENHVYWSSFFSWLEKNTLSSVSYGGFTGDLTGVYGLSAKAHSLSEVSWQVKVLSDDPLTNAVNVSEAQATEGKEKGSAGEVTFSLDLKINPEIFKK